MNFRQARADALAARVGVWTAPGDEEGVVFPASLAAGRLTLETALGRFAFGPGG